MLPTGTATGYGLRATGSVSRWARFAALLVWNALANWNDRP